VLAIPNALRLWRRCRDRYHGSVTELAKLAGSEREAVSPVDVIASTEAVEDLVRDENERNRAIMKLVALDFDPAEIAEVLRLTPAAVHARMSRLRRKYGSGEGRAE
jgi:DNA-directed RNA polymerase specialized sigma24 family protein